MRLYIVTIGITYLEHLVLHVYSLENLVGVIPSKDLLLSGTDRTRGFVNCGPIVLVVQSSMAVGVVMQLQSKEGCTAPLIRANRAGHFCCKGSD